ncbi:MAG: DNA/RNA non-specific endonuclease [Clostridium beijerinckii]
MEGLVNALKEVVNEVASYTDFMPNFSENLKLDSQSFDDADKPINYGHNLRDANSTYEENGSIYETDDNGKPYKKDGEVLSNTSYEIDGNTYETDDNGKTYKKDGELLPNTDYEINGYKYETDDKGRIISAEGTLHLSDTGRKTINEDNVGGEDKRETDDRGHLIADRFDGSNKIENLVPMDSNLNRGDFKKIENLLADALADGKEATLKVEPQYDGDSKRPSSFVVTYSIDGEEKVVVFSNERKDSE